MIYTFTLQIISITIIIVIIIVINRLFKDDIKSYKWEMKIVCY